MKKEIDLKKRMQEIKFTTENHLTKEQFRKLIDEKYERARVLRDQLTKKEHKAQIFDLWFPSAIRKRDPVLHYKKAQMGGLGDGLCSCT